MNILYKIIEKIILIIELLGITIIIFTIFITFTDLKIELPPAKARYKKGGFDKEFIYTNNIEIYPGIRMWVQEGDDIFPDIIPFNTETNISFDKYIIVVYTNITTNTILLSHTSSRALYYSLYTTNKTEISILNGTNKYLTFCLRPVKIPYFYERPFKVRNNIYTELLAPISKIYNVDTNEEYIFKLALWLYDKNKKEYYLSKPVVLKVKNRQDKQSMKK